MRYRSNIFLLSYNSVLSKMCPKHACDRPVLIEDITAQQYYAGATNITLLMADDGVSQQPSTTCFRFKLTIIRTFPAHRHSNIVWKT
mmetsp:Transcript_17795/g.35821  ORF Transcript_17795/g.35821 Transcript_17795/m.35821 type:complete len:87 (-) Transcript_17795:682-942(-)